MPLNGIQEVSGSIPLISTKEKSPKTLKIKASGLFLLPDIIREKYGEIRANPVLLQNYY